MAFPRESKKNKNKNVMQQTYTYIHIQVLFSLKKINHVVGHYVSEISQRKKD